MLLVSPQKIILQESDPESILFENNSEAEALHIELKICHKTANSEQMISAPEAFLLSTYSLDIQPLATQSIEIQYIPLESVQCEVAKIIISFCATQLQIPLLGLTGICRVIQDGTLVLNTGTCNAIVRLQSGLRLLHPTEFFHTKEQGLLFFPEYLQTLEHDAEISRLIASYADSEGLLQNLAKHVPAINEIKQSSEILANSLNTSQKITNAPAELGEKTFTLQNETLEVASVAGESPESFSSNAEEGDVEQINSEPLSAEQPNSSCDSNLRNKNHAANNSGVDNINPELLSPSLREKYSRLQQSRAPEAVKKQYLEELLELDRLERENNATLEDYHYIYENETVPDFLPVPVRYVENSLHYTPQNLKFINEVPIYLNTLNTCYWRVLNTYFILETPSQQFSMEKIVESATAVNFYFTGQLNIENTSDQTGFVEQVAKMYPLFNQVAQEACQNLLPLYYNIDFITQNYEFRGFKIAIKADEKLSGIVQPGEVLTINITIQITATNVENNELFEVPEIFQNIEYDMEKNSTTPTTNLFVRINGFRYSRAYTEEEFDQLPKFLPGQNDDEIREAFDIPVIFGDQVLTERRPEQTVSKDEVFPQGDYRVERIGKLTQAFNLQYLRFLAVLPLVKVGDVACLGTIKLKRQEKLPSVVQQRESENVEKYMQKRAGVLSFSPVHVRAAKTPRYSAQFIANQSDEAGAERLCSYPVVFKHKSVEYVQQRLSRMEISSYPVNLPRCSENCEFPILAHCFECRTRPISVGLREMFTVNDYIAGKIEYACKLSQETVNSLINILSRTARQPVHVEQEFSIVVKSLDSENACFVEFPVLLRCRLELDAQQFNYTQDVVGRQCPIKNVVQGLNMRLINGYSDQVFTTAKVLTFKPVFFMSEASDELVLYNGSGKSIVCFCEGKASPFSCDSTFTVKGNSLFKHRIFFKPKDPGNYNFDLTIRWADSAKVKKNEENGSIDEQFHQFDVKLVASAMNIPLLVKQNADDFPAFLKVASSEYSVFYIVNIAHMKSLFNIQCDELEIFPTEGVVEPGAAAVVKCQWRRNVENCKVLITASCFGNSGVVFDGIAERE